jgi:hypothetical protein
MKLRSHLAAALAALAVVGAVAIAPATPAYAAANVTVTVEGDSTKVGVADPTYVTELRVTGSGFQSIKNGFGGIYVMFGWVDGDGWQPSKGGVTGVDYRYVPDDESAPTGYINFVTFPGSSTAYAANGGEIAADGTWSAVMTVPGATFQSLDRDGNPSEVNCLQVQCGIITIGAHGVKNPSNESFTPVRFENLYEEGAAPVAPDPASQAQVAATPAPTQTVIVEEPAQAAAADPDSGNGQLITILLWIAGGVGVLAVGAIAFMVWAVLSARRRQRAAAAAATAQPAAAPAEPAAVPGDGAGS